MKESASERRKRKEDGNIVYVIRSRVRLEMECFSFCLQKITGPEFPDCRHRKHKNCQACDVPIRPPGIHRFASDKARLRIGPRCGNGSCFCQDEGKDRNGSDNQQNCPCAHEHELDQGSRIVMPPGQDLFRDRPDRGHDPPHVFPDPVRSDNKVPESIRVLLPHLDQQAGCDPCQRQIENESDGGDDDRRASPRPIVPHTDPCGCCRLKADNVDHPANMSRHRRCAAGHGGPTPPSGSPHPGAAAAESWR